MAKYCPSCGNESADLINYCWNCGQYLGRGRVSELETKESSQRVKAELGLDERTSLPENKQYVNKDETSLALFTVYGVTKGELDELLKKHNIEVDYVDTPGVCKSDEAVSQYEFEEQRNRRTKTDSSSYGSSYYYSDPTANICCYYTCFPRPYGCGSSHYSSGRGHGSNSCDCADSDNDSDSLGGLIVILILIAIIGFLILAAPTIAAVGLVVLDLIMALALLLFNILTLGIYKDDLSRTRIKIRKATTDDITRFTYDLASKKGLPKIPGYWSSGYLFIRYGALFFITGLILLIIALVYQSETKIYYFLPVSVTIMSIGAFIVGHWLINRKVEEVKSMLS
jgi:hypothetical protein